MRRLQSETGGSRGWFKIYRGWGYINTVVSLAPQSTVTQALTADVYIDSQGEVQTSKMKCDNLLSRLDELSGMTPA